MTFIKNMKHFQHIMLFLHISILLTNILCEIDLLYHKIKM